MRLHGDAIVCLLEDVNTPAQTALAQCGRLELAQNVHNQLQMDMAEELRDIVHRATGQTARGYVPGFNAEIDATIDVVFLQPENPDPAAFSTITDQ